MSWAHIHLALNHVPVIGLPIVVLLLLWGLVRRNAELIRAAFGLLVLLALVTLVVQLTGEPAEDLVEGLPGVLDSMVETARGSGSHRHHRNVGTRSAGAVRLAALPRRAHAGPLVSRDRADRGRTVERLLRVGRQSRRPDPPFGDPAWPGGCAQSWRRSGGTEG